MKRTITSGHLLLTSVSAILGSGWLFTALFVAMYTGYMALWAWVIGAALVLLVAFTLAETTVLFPVSGASSRVTQFTHGTFTGFLFSWIIWLSYAAVTPAEVQAILQYMAYSFPGLIYPSGALTAIGYLWAFILMAALCTINMVSLNWLIRCNSFLTLIKIVIPVTIAVFILMKVLPQHHHLLTNKTHHTPASLSLLAALSVGGIIFSFNGFKQACEMAGETKNPKFSVPFALIGSVLICLVIYLLLQLAFLISITPQNITLGWQHLQIPHNTSPFASILFQDHLSGLLLLLYIGALIGPFAAALMYISSASRSLVSMSENHYLPAIFKKGADQGTPYVAIITNVIFGLCLFAPLPGWEIMLRFLSALMIMTYSVAPICTITLRYQLPHQPRLFRLPCAHLLCFLAFYACALLTYWTGWQVISKIIETFALGIFLFMVKRYFFISSEERAPLELRYALWALIYFIGILWVSYLGRFGGGTGQIPYGWDFIIIALICFVSFNAAILVRLPSDQTKKYLSHIKHHHEPHHDHS